jgi:3-deoxy-D-manno-octulosonic-acid transferase
VKDRFVRLGAAPEAIHVTGDVKASRALDHPDPSLLDEIKAQIGSRPCWLAASTHPGEDESVADVHCALAAEGRNLLTIIAPRHDWRGDEIEKMLTARGLSVARRSKGQSPEGAAIYLADTLGEMPLWYAVCPIAYVGAGWGALGGHNPLEPAQAGVAVLSGPKVMNFEESYAALVDAKAARFVADESVLTKALLDLTDEFGHPNHVAKSMADAGKDAAAPDPAPLERIMVHLRPLAERAFR